MNAMWAGDLERFQQGKCHRRTPRNDFLIALYELVNKLGLHAVGEKSKVEPLIAKKDTYYETIDRHVKKGQLLGNYVESTITTKEGIDLVCDFVSKMSEEGDTDLNKWEIKGIPNINIITEHMQGEITTGSNIINRIRRYQCEARVFTQVKWSSVLNLGIRSTIQY